MNAYPFEAYMLVLGEQHPAWERPPTDGLRFHFADNIAQMQLSYTRPEQIEMAAFNTRPLQIGLLRYSETLLFFLARIPDCTDGWCDSPFAMGRLPAFARAPGHREKHDGVTLIASLVDRATGIIRCLQATSMSNSFATILDGYLDEQRAKIGAFNEARYNDEIAAAYARWPHPDRMAEEAAIIERAGPHR